MQPAQPTIGVNSRSRSAGRMPPRHAGEVDLSADSQAVGPAHGHGFHGMPSNGLVPLSILIRRNGLAIHCRVAAKSG